jgi:chemotaxis response regulator CheB
MGRLEPQEDQGEDDPVGEDQLVIGPSTGGPQAFASTALV